MIVAADSHGQQPGVGANMKKANLFIELVATYRKHGWELRRALMQPATLAELGSEEAQMLNRVDVRESPIDALWFSRSSSQNREAWELRLLEQTQYALFETFEADEAEDEREEVKLEMEARLREHVLGS